jgi:lysine-specific demethylase/histidyl-hydroxylase NO66
MDESNLYNGEAMTDLGLQPGDNVGGTSMWTLDSVIRPFTRSQFAEILERRVPLVFPALDPASATSLLSWHQVEGLLTSFAIPPKLVQVTRDGEAVPSPFYCLNGRLHPARLLALLDRGHSIVIKRVEQIYPPAAALKSDIERVIGDRVRVSLVSTTGSGGALARHFDRGDVLAIQLEGAKLWHIYDSPVENPVPASPDVERTADGGTERDVLLRCGDRLLIPSGYWHRCENQQGRSLHLAVVFNPLCAQVLLAAIAKALVADPECRRPESHRLVPADRAAMIAEMKEALLRRIETMSVDELADAYLSDNNPAGAY